jgi:hypothetical protein
MAKRAFNLHSCACLIDHQFAAAVRTIKNDVSFGDFYLCAFDRIRSRRILGLISVLLHPQCSSTNPLPVQNQEGDAL